jgi:hypothetical protein
MSEGAERSEIGLIILYDRGGRHFIMECGLWLFPCLLWLHRMLMQSMLYIII